MGVRSPLLRSALRRLHLNLGSSVPSASGPAEIVAAVGAMIERETARVDDPVTGVPGGDPRDVDGWHTYDSSGRPDTRPGRPIFDPEAWRWFRLVDLAMLDGTVLIKFAWAEPGSPDLQYLKLAPVGPYGMRSADEAASVVRSHLRVLLAPLDALASAPTNSTPGWRYRVNRTWLSRTLVVVSDPHEAVSQEELNRTWHQPTATDDAR